MEDGIATFKRAHSDFEFELLENKPASIEEWPEDFISSFCTVGEQSLTSTPIFFWNISLYFPTHPTNFVQQLLDEERNQNLSQEQQKIIDWVDAEYKIVWEQQFAVCHSNPSEGFCLICIDRGHPKGQMVDVMYFNLQEKILHPFQMPSDCKPKEGLPSCHLAFLQWGQGSRDRFSVWLNNFNQFTISQQRKSISKEGTEIPCDLVKLEYHYKSPVVSRNPKIGQLVTRIKAFFQSNSGVIFTSAPSSLIADCSDFTDFYSSLGEQHPN